MPKRVLDGEGMWKSDKLSHVEPPRRRSEYANLLPLALANGVFEANPRRIWSTVYSYNRPDVPAEEVEQILEEFERVKLLFRWIERETGKVWGFWVGIDKPGRLPGKSRWGKNEAIGPTPPPQELKHFLDSNGIHKLPNGNGMLLGFGSGFGSGINLSSEQKASSDGASAIPKEKTPKEPSSEACRLAALLKSEILSNKVDYRITSRQERKWAVTAQRMIDIDNRDPQKIANLIGWVQRDEFWMANVLSMDTLRAKFDQLSLKKEKSSAKNSVSTKLPDSYIPASEQIREERRTQEKKQDE